MALVTALAAGLALSPPLDSLPNADGLFGHPSPPAAIQKVAATPASAESAEKGCSTDAAKGLIKAELFDRASRLRGSETSILAPVADRSLVRVDLAEAKGGGDTGGVSCGGWLAIDLPTDVAVEGGRRNLNAEIIYALVPAGSNGLRLTALSGVNGLAQSLATFGRAVEPEVLAEVPDTAGIAHAVPVATSDSLPPPVRGVAAPLSPAPVRRSAAIGAEVPASPNVAALDKHLDLFMIQSLARADAAKRQALEASEQSFRKRRDACRSEACETAAYVGQMQNVSQIMAARRP